MYKCSHTHTCTCMHIHTQFSGANPEKLVVTTKHFLESESKGAYSPGKGYR